MENTELIKALREDAEWMLYRASVDRLSDGEYMFVPDNLTVFAHKPGGEQDGD